MLKNNKNISARIFYSGKPVVFLHAFPVNHKMWQPQMEFLSKKQVGFIAPDYPGFGLSALPEKQLSISDYGESVYRVLQELGVQSAVFVG